MADGRHFEHVFLHISAANEICTWVQILNSAMLTRQIIKILQFQGGQTPSSKSFFCYNSSPDISNQGEIWRHYAESRAVTGYMAIIEHFKNSRWRK